MLVAPREMLPLVPAATLSHPSGTALSLRPIRICTNGFNEIGCIASTSVARSGPSSATTARG
jgi:hypothetical protein